MRIFRNTEEAYPEILRDIVKRGVEYHSSSVQGKSTKGDDNYTYKELTLYSFMIEHPQDAVEQSKDPEWVNAEFTERVSTINMNPGEAYKLREDLWKPMLNANGKFDYSYNERIGWEHIVYVTNNICNFPSSRRNIISVWDDSIDKYRLEGPQRVPCSMYYNFRERNGVIDIIYHMRSSDYYEHFKNDIALAYLLLKYVVDVCNYDLPQENDCYKVGKLFMTIDSLHAYKKDWGKLEIY